MSEITIDDKIKEIKKQKSTKCILFVLFGISISKPLLEYFLIVLECLNILLSFNEETQLKEVDLAYIYLHSSYEHYVSYEDMLEYFENVLELDTFASSELNNFLETQNQLIDKVGLLIIENKGEFRAENIIVKCEVLRNEDYYDDFKNDLYNWSCVDISDYIIDESGKKEIEYITIPNLYVEENVAIPIFFTIKDNENRVIVEYKPIEIEYVDIRNNKNITSNIRKENEKKSFSNKYIDQITTLIGEPSIFKDDDIEPLEE